MTDGDVIMVELGLLDVAGGLVVGSDNEPAAVPDPVWAKAAIGSVNAKADARRIVFIEHLLETMCFRDMRRKIATAIGFSLSPHEECLSRCRSAASCHGVNVTPKLPAQGEKHEFNHAVWAESIAGGG